MNRVLDRGEVVRPLGVIDTLTAGYETINRRLWLLFFPISLDVLFWLGPKLSIVWLAGYLPFTTLSSDQAAVLREMLAQFNLAFLLAPYIPTVLGWELVGSTAPDMSRVVPRVIYHVLPPSLGLALATLLPLGFLVTALYLGGIGQVVRGEPARGPWLASWLRSGARYWWRILALHLLAIGALVVVVLPWTVVLAIVSAVSPDFGSFLLLLFQVSLIWLAFYFFFSLDAVIVADASPVRAALSSMRVIRANFWSAVALVGLMLVIQVGLPIVWRAISGQPLGLVASIVANAYVGTGLAAASMRFYRDRVDLLQQVRGQTIGNH